MISKFTYQLKTTSRLIKKGFAKPLQSASTERLIKWNSRQGFLSASRCYFLCRPKELLAAVLHQLQTLMLKYRTNPSFLKLLESFYGQFYFDLFFKLLLMCGVL